MPYELSDKCAPKSPFCPACAQIMRVAPRTSRFDDRPDPYTFECRACGVWYIEPALSAYRGTTSPEKREVYLEMARI